MTLHHTSLWSANIAHTITSTTPPYMARRPQLPVHGWSSTTHMSTTLPSSTILSTHTTSTLHPSTTIPSTTLLFISPTPHATLPPNTIPMCVLLHLLKSCYVLYDSNALNLICYKESLELSHIREEAINSCNYHHVIPNLF
ncbi:unnamed protein product [Brassica rapa subsp. trilocularis]